MENSTNDFLEEVDTVISSDPGKSEETLTRGSEKKGPSVIVPIIVVLAVTALGIFFWKSGYLTIPSTADVDTILVIEPRELTIDMNNSTQIRVYIQGADVESREEITDQVQWYSSDLDIVTVANNSSKGQIVSRDVEGEAFITMIYGDQTEIIPVVVTRAKMAVECYPVLAAQWTVEGIKTAKVGEEIDWMGFYTKIGSPNYDYKWTGTEGMDSDWAIPTKTYKTPGLKEVHFWTKDTAGTVAEADCSITIVK